MSCTQKWRTFRIINKSCINTGVSDRCYATKFNINANCNNFWPKIWQLCRAKCRKFWAQNETKRPLPSPSAISVTIRLLPSPLLQRRSGWGGGRGPNVSCQLKFRPFVRKRARLFTVWVPYFLVRSSGSSPYRYGRPSWFHVYRGAGVAAY